MRQLHPTHLHHEVLAEAPAGLRALLPQRAHVVLEAAQVLGEGHEQQGAQLQQEGAPRLLGPGRVLQGVRQHHAPGGREEGRVRAWMFTVPLSEAICKAYPPGAPLKMLHRVTSAWHYLKCLSFMSE